MSSCLLLVPSPPFPSLIMDITHTALSDTAQTVDAPLLAVMKNFSAIYDLHHDAIYRYCNWKCRDNEVGQDLMQETFMRLYLSLQRKKEIQHVRAFLYRIAHNLIIDHVRGKKEASLDEMLETGFEPSVDLWHQTYSRLDSEKWFKKLSKMAKPYRQVLHRRFILGLNPSEIATMTGETSNTVSVRIYRGLTQLRA